jgi:hypothetical protein
VRLDVGVEVILAVVVGDLVAGFDVLDRLDADAPVADHRIGIAAAGMIDVARDVRTRLAVDGPARIHLEQSSDCPESRRIAGWSAVARDIRQ